ncbi:glycosyltransferase family 2 protein [bacterium]|nr:glycosyltransferase family 2 protein [bacterium]NDD85006.1 glycosyltransferase family 2 protein [bacterium]
MVAGPKTLVSIINWNNTAATHACLDSVARIAKADQPDVYLIDNNSQIEPFELSKHTSDNLKSVTLFKNTRNDGFAGGHNKAISYAQDSGYDYVCLLNNDAQLLDTTVFSKLADALNNDAKAVAAAPTILSSTNPNTIWFAGGTMQPKKSFVTHNFVGQDTSALHSLDNVTSCTFLTGCCLMIALNKYPQVKKTLDEQYFLYWEDADWCASALRAGANLLYVKDARVLHATSSSLGIRSASYAYYNIRNRLLFAKKWSSSKFVIFDCVWTGFKIIGLSLKLPTTTFKTIWYIKRALFDGVKGNTGPLK